ncbi:MAG: hypothetical protein IKM54_03490, partial [Butyricicoccus sp.]|nr:hypothetical protein [Butyricicoccus sp.]
AFQLVETYFAKLPRISQNCEILLFDPEDNPDGFLPNQLSLRLLFQQSSHTRHRGGHKDRRLFLLLFPMDLAEIRGYNKNRKL